MSQIILVVGRRGFGKSTHLRNELIPAIPQPVVVFDVKGEYNPEHGFDEVHYDADAFLDGGPFWRASCRFDDDDTLMCLDALYHYSPHVVVIEEAWRFCTAHRVAPELDNLVRMGRLPQISTVLVTQRARDFPQILWGMSDRLVVFQQRSESDVAAISYQLDDEAADRVRSLKIGERAEFTL